MKDATSSVGIVVCVILIIVCLCLAGTVAYFKITNEELRTELSRYEAVAPDIYTIKELHPRSHLLLIDYCTEVTYAYRADSGKWLGRGFDNGRCLVDVVEHGLSSGYSISKLCPKINGKDYESPTTKELDKK